MDVEIIRSQAAEAVSTLADELTGLSRFIFTHPEEGMQEFESARVQVEYLRAHGFAVETGLAELPTSFLARFRNGDGPTIALFSEYDCLPNGLGHACGHNLISIAAVGAGVAARIAMERLGLHGTVCVVGSPDEEITGGKIPMLRAGLFDRFDAAMAVHPTSATSRIAGGCNAYHSFHCVYTGKSAHSGSHPWEGVNAQDAALLFLNALSYARQMVRDGVRMQGYVTEGMQPSGSIIGRAEVECELAAPDYRALEEAAKRVRMCLEAGAVGTGCTWKTTENPGSKNRIPNAVLGDVFRRHAEAYGEPMLPGMPSDSGGEDLGNVSHLIPAINPHMTILPGEKISGHTPRFREQAGGPEGLRMMLLSAKTMAASTLELFDSPELLQQAKAELEARLLQTYGPDYELFRR